jgi:hypothetical protein
MDCGYNRYHAVSMFPHRMNPFIADRPPYPLGVVHHVVLFGDQFKVHGDMLL